RDRPVAKLTDFGFSRFCLQLGAGTRVELSDTHCGSLAYVAPEILQSRRYSALVSDVWSVGVVLYVLLNARLPFPVGEDQGKLIRRQLEHRIKFPNRTLSAEAED